MHLGNGAITPECAMITASIAAIGLSYAAATARKENASLGMWMKAGAYGAAIFAAQMINVPLLTYSSGHLVGGVLLAITLGPRLGALSMAVVLALQAILLGDGGLAALGANIVNMALVPALVVTIAHKQWGEKASSPVNAGVMAASGVVLAAGLIVLEVAVFRSASDSRLFAFAGQMLQTHVVIGMAEGLLTGAIIGATAWTAASSKKLAVVAAVAALALVAVVPLSSPLPDGYEASAQRSGWSALLLEGSINTGWTNAQASIVENVAMLLPGEWLIAFVATALAGTCCAALAVRPARDRSMEAVRL